ncbi:MAG: NUDIX hydrolase [Candidatus Wallbacteria bacterium]|nr:NUDIX hydrolase [Candidatus Wallbacteria bacterium]
MGNSDATRSIDDYTYYSQLPAKRMGSGALFFDQDGRFLVLKTTYKSTWEIPGGVVEKDESPLQACVREVREETGLEIDAQNLALLCLEYATGNAVRTESLMFIFDGGTFSAAGIDAIRPDGSEIVESMFVTLEQAQSLLSPTLWNRVRLAINSKREARIAYFETVRK